ncbi:Chitin synthase 4 [Trametes pubescens]|uniref:Chitin synthase n=1 Tax=Trametes pubescens TaxID=154538 RepID=A0A1M2V8N3_TRAPU|nr:Chitin synthase 4 [Trametes pubescens]
MPRNLEADEAQHGHFNDGYSPYRESLDSADSGHDLSPNVAIKHPPPSPLGQLSNALQTPQLSSHHPPRRLDSNSYASGFPQLRSSPQICPSSSSTRPEAAPPPSGDAIPTADVHGSVKSDNVPESDETGEKVMLVGGNYVLELQMPTKLLAESRFDADREFKTMRYSAATCDPNDYEESGFRLRQVDDEYNLPHRRTELFIVMTMYNEDERMFCGTMAAIVRNIEYLCKQSDWEGGSESGWEKVVVCIVADGRSKIPERTLNAIAAIGAYQKGSFAQSEVQTKPVTAHIYESTIQSYIPLTSEGHLAEKNQQSAVPVQVIFCLKEKNQKKLNSHRWFFNAFGKLLEPEVCVLLDVGTIPEDQAIYHMWKAFRNNANIGGACGEIIASRKAHKWSPLVSAQYFEYKISNILDKAL